MRNAFRLLITVGNTFLLVITVENTFSPLITVENTFPLVITAGKNNSSSFFLKKGTTSEMSSMGHRTTCKKAALQNPELQNTFDSNVEKILKN